MMKSIIYVALLTVGIVLGGALWYESSEVARLENVVTGLAEQLKAERAEPIYLRGTVEVDGKVKPLCVNVIDAIHLTSIGSVDYKLRRQATPCAGIFTRGGD